MTKKYKTLHPARRRGLRLRLDRGRVGVWGLRVRSSPSGKGLFGGGARVRQPLRRRRLRRVDPARTAPLLLLAEARVAGRSADDLLQGRLRRLRQRRRRRQPRLCQHPLPRPALLLRRPAVGADGQLGAGPRPPLRHGGADARGHRVRRDGPGRPAAEGIRRGDRRRRDLHQHPRRGLLRPARQDRARPLLRRRGTRPHRLHALRQLHGRLPPRRQEHADEELPLVRREARRQDPARNARSRRSGRSAPPTGPTATRSPPSARAPGSDASAGR